MEARLCNDDGNSAPSFPSLLRRHRVPRIPQPRDPAVMCLLLCYGHRRKRMADHGLRTPET